MSTRTQLVELGAHATSFTAVCVECCDLDTTAGYSGSTFAGRLDLDIHRATFLCRRGHAIEVARAEPPALPAAGAAA